MLYSLQPFYNSLSQHFNAFLHLSFQSVLRDTYSYIKRYQKATKGSQDSGPSLGCRMNVEHGRVLFVGTFPDLQPA